jgi:hypothetical protein
MEKTVLVTGGTAMTCPFALLLHADPISASGLLGRQVLKTFRFDGWEATGTGVHRISPPEIVKLDLFDAESIPRLLDYVKSV